MDHASIELPDSITCFTLLNLYKDESGPILIKADLSPTWLVGAFSLLVAQRRSTSLQMTPGSSLGLGTNQPEGQQHSCS